MFEKAAQLDSHYAEAFAGIGWTSHMDWVWQWNKDPQVPERAFELAQKARALLEGARQRLTFRDPAKKERLLNDLRKAGLK
jgi:hypothetical protein